MGMYTELVAAFSIPHLSDVKLSIIKYMLHETSEIPNNEYLQHSLFKTDRWPNMLKSDSYYFPGQTSSFLMYDEISKEHYLTVRFNLKNYCGEIKKFLNWIWEIADDRGFVGYTRYEEAENPTLIYFEDSGVEFR